MLEIAIQEHPRLPKPRRKRSAVALAALALYDEIAVRPQYPTPDRRRRALTAQLHAALADMELADRADYYAGLVERRARS